MQGTLLVGDGEGCPQADEEALPRGYNPSMGAAPSQPWHLSTIRKTLEHIRGYFPVLVTPANHLVPKVLGCEVLHLGDAGSFIWGRGVVLQGVTAMWKR